jgi:hypothetical protein
VQLSSDEALLSDFSPLKDDRSPLPDENSSNKTRTLREVIQYVLSRAIPGATLAASPAVDADVTPLWEVTNLVSNPSAGIDHAGYLINSGTGTLSRVADPDGTSWLRVTASANGGPWFVGGINVRPGTQYTTVAVVKSNRDVPVRILHNYNTETGAMVPGDDASEVFNLKANVAQVVHVTGTAPANASGVRPYVNPYGPGSDITGGDYLQIRALTTYENPTGVVIQPFDGGFIPNDRYTYSWDADAHRSASKRTPVRATPNPEALIWSAGTTALDFVHPLIQANGYRLVCDEQRVWTLRDEKYEASGALALRHGVNLIDASEDITRESGIWFDARVTRYRWTDAVGTQQEKVDAYALSENYTRLTTVDVNRPYPGPGRSEYAVRRAQGLGREVTAESVIDLTAHAEQLVNVLMEHAPIQIGLTNSVTFDLDTDRMTITTRATDTPAGAVNLLTGTVNNLTGTVNNLNN